MERITIASVFADGERLDGRTVTVMGWARTIRDLKGFGFIELNDGSCLKNLQVVMESGALENYRDIAAQNVGAALIVTGTVVLTPDAKQPLELKASAIQVEGTSTPDYPLQKNATAWSSSGPSSTCGPGRTCSPPPSASGARRPTRFTTSSRAGALSTSTPPSSPPATARAQARCSGSAPWIPRTRP